MEEDISRGASLGNGSRARETALVDLAAKGLTLRLDARGLTKVRARQHVDRSHCAEARRDDVGNHSRARRLDAIRDQIEDEDRGISLAPSCSAAEVELSATGVAVDSAPSDAPAMEMAKMEKSVPPNIAARA